MSCKICFHFEESDQEYPQGKCWYFRDIGNLSIPAVDLSVHGLNGCIHHREKGSKPITPAIPVEKDYHDTDSDIPF